ncbi:hypothetical protein [Clostridium septicum]|uniref:Uncharacterized protein n=1 Tax=Clostridium septicum TaxID=1504 RepID=A0A9N7JK37_CLOSE|nr:hypothetical protein [Clostridium septicum]AYE34078.1 hypothetical protein CP523_06130 [Clostridium septicum]MDU1313532.1 hypothetical protein [Clostridium septicum]QAS59447.1 hypothetical protein EI377_00600 [Clostridium septicum]UEC21299.1 hypothetical protein LK444_02685 [Clostridium septicum]USS00657.1 hypothetical protein NH397_14415 [Clostridium septicum]
MNSIVFILVIASAVFVSFKMAEEKGQSKYIWSLATAMIGPFVIIVQYITHYFRNKNKLSTR